MPIRYRHYIKDIFDISTHLYSDCQDQNLDSENTVLRGDGVSRRPPLHIHRYRAQNVCAPHTNILANRNSIYYLRNC